jgi:membrane fusion protein, multidrug efflux system
MMKHNLLSLVPRLVLSLLLATLFTSCAEKKQDSVDVARVVAVKAMVVQPSDRQITRTYTGSLEGEQQADLYARLPEAVKEIVATTGKRVKADDVILTLDKYGPSSSYAQVLSVYENAKKNYDKMQFLFTQGAISESEHDGAKTTFEVAESQFESVRRMIEIHTPIAGIVTQINVSPGDLVQVGQALATVATTDKLRVKFAVNSDDLALVKDGDEVLVRNDATGATASGKVVKVASSADPATRSFTVEALIQNDAALFNPGMFVHIDYILEQLTGVLAVPRDVILILDKQATVFVAVGKKALQRRVVLGPEMSGYVVITSGLNAGDTLVTLGQDYLEDGLSLNVTELGENK